MEIKIKDKLLLNGRFGTIKKIDTIYQTIINKFKVKHSADLHASETIPYEITPQCKSDALEFERKQVQAMADFQKMRNFRAI